jgi:hypothetical protein
MGTILDTLLSISKTAAAFITQAVQRAVAEQATEGCGVGIFVTRKVLTFLMLKKIIIGHGYSSCK